MLVALGSGGSSGARVKPRAGAKVRATLEVRGKTAQPTNTPARPREDLMGCWIRLLFADDTLELEVQY